MRKLFVILFILSVAACASAQSLVMFSEYIEGSSNNKAVEIYNNTNQPIDLSRITIERYNNGSTDIGYVANLVGMLDSGDVWVIANSSAVSGILDVADDTVNSAFTYYNGDDVLILYFDGVIVDSIGRLGEDPGDFWGTEPCTTKEHTLVRKSTVCIGDTDTSDAYDPAGEWDCYDQDDFTHLGAHSSTCSPVANDAGAWSSIKALYR